LDPCSLFEKLRLLDEISEEKQNIAVRNVEIFGYIVKQIEAEIRKVQDQINEVIFIFYDNTNFYYSIILKIMN